MMLIANAPDYGSLNALVHAASALVSTTIAIGALWWLRPTLSDIPEGIIKAGEVVFSGIGIALVWTQLSDLSASPAIIKWIEILAVGLLISLIALVIMTVGRIVLRYRDTPDEARVLGGLWLTSEARKVRDKFGGVQEAYEAFLYNHADLWSVPSRVVACILFLIFDLMAVVCGSVALTATAMLIMIYQVPKIYEFSVSPTAVEAKGTTTIRWRVSENATQVRLDPFDQVARQGARIETIAKDTDFRLTATNFWGNRNVEQSVTVHPSIPSSPPRPHKAATDRPPRFIDIIVEARTCSLIKNVVIRGEGWLETENEKDSEAESRAKCAVRVQREAKYEIFVTYAANESRPVRMTLNEQIIDENALAASTGGWNEPNQKEQSIGVWPVPSGENTLEFYAIHPIPHIQRIRFRLSS